MKTKQETANLTLAQKCAALNQELQVGYYVFSSGVVSKDKNADSQISGVIIWKNSDESAEPGSRALMITLDNCLCNALILNGKVYQGYLSSGTLEHMVLHPNGKQCYCGKKGCVDSYCSAASLIRMTRMSLAIAKNIFLKFSAWTSTLSAE